MKAKKCITGPVLVIIERRKVVCATVTFYVNVHNVTYMCVCKHIAISCGHPTTVGFSEPSGWSLVFELNSYKVHAYVLLWLLNAKFKKNVC